MPSNKSEPSDICYCGTAVAYSTCCGRYLDNGELPETAEQLMRSRYTAFVLGNESYLLSSWHPSTRPSRVRHDDNQRWLGLKIKDTEHGGAKDTTGSVEYVARFKVAGKGHRLHEISQFKKTSGRWFYVDGKHL
ncbi:MAG: YchJ family metal-binding protein [Halioglobus sp.]